MVEEQKRRVEDRMSEMIEELDKTYLRKMQGDMHRCAAACCNDPSSSMPKVHRCIENCSTSLNKAQNYVQTELERVQTRLQRCVMECNDSIRDQMSANPSQDEVNKFSDSFERCATKCVDVYCDLLPSLEKTMKKTLAGSKFDQ